MTVPFGSAIDEGARSSDDVTAVAVTADDAGSTISADRAPLERRGARPLAAPGEEAGLGAAHRGVAAREDIGIVGTIIGSPAQQLT